jgi:beta-aspartyl-peptidase (threonine type)
MNSVAAAPMLLVHGGAGVIRREMDSDTEHGVRAALAEALRCGRASLAAGGSALDAVTAAVAVLEDAPHFNAGHGAVFTHDEINELDARSWMARRCVRVRWRACATCATR